MSQRPRQWAAECPHRHALTHSSVDHSDTRHPVRPRLAGRGFGADSSRDRTGGRSGRERSGEPSRLELAAGADLTQSAADSSADEEAPHVEARFTSLTTAFVLHTVTGSQRHSCSRPRCTAKSSCTAQQASSDTRDATRGSAPISLRLHCNKARAIVPATVPAAGASHSDPHNITSE